MGDNNGMPSDSRGPMSDLAQSIAHHETPPPDPTPSTSGRNSNDSISNDSSDSAISNSGAGDGKKSDGLKASISSKVQSALRQAANMDSVAEGEQAKSNKRWRRSSSLQTIALDSGDLPNSPPSSSSPEVSPPSYLAPNALQCSASIAVWDGYNACLTLYNTSCCLQAVMDLGSRV